MNVLFVTLSHIESINDGKIYTDLMRKFVEENHNVFIVSPNERRLQRETTLIRNENCTILQVRVGNIQKTNVIEKGISTLLIEYQFRRAIKKYFSDIKFDLVLYTTPPITFAKVIQFVKRRDKARSYLMLKDIFPQNAVDLGMFSKKSPIYWFFRAKEKRLYRLSDQIGCMSEANVAFMVKNNPDINPGIVHILPNSMRVMDSGIQKKKKRNELRKRYGIPLDARVFVFGGNLGKPQDIPFIIQCLKKNEDRSDCFFVMCGNGTEYAKLKAYVDESNPRNVLLIAGMPRRKYDRFIVCCDVGLIFLDHRFTIPNFPSRLLSYMQHGMPVIACTDPNTDVGQVIKEGGFGWWCESNDVDGFTAVVNAACQEPLEEKGKNARNYLMEHYTVDKSYEIIMERIQ